MTDGTWRFASDPGDVQVWQAVWSDNRDVIPPPDGDWSKYVAPIATGAAESVRPDGDHSKLLTTSPSLTLGLLRQGSLYTGTRNQNVYSASISNGVIVAAPGNNRPLDGFDNTGAPLQRGFVVYVQNTTGQARDFRLSLPSTPSGIEASFAPNAGGHDERHRDPAVFECGGHCVRVTLIGAPMSEAIPVSVAELGGTLTGSVCSIATLAPPIRWKLLC